jgi:hypothetical protein
MMKTVPPPPPYYREFDRTARKIGQNFPVMGVSPGIPSYLRWFNWRATLEAYPNLYNINLMKTKNAYIKYYGRNGFSSYAECSCILKFSLPLSRSKAWQKKYF